MKRTCMLTVVLVLLFSLITPYSSAQAKTTTDAPKTLTVSLASYDYTGKITYSDVKLTFEKMRDDEYPYAYKHVYEEGDILHVCFEKLPSSKKITGNVFTFSEYPVDYMKSTFDVDVESTQMAIATFALYKKGKVVNAERYDYWNYVDDAHSEFDYNNLLNTTKFDTYLVSGKHVYCRTYGGVTRKDGNKLTMLSFVDNYDLDFTSKNVKLDAKSVKSFKKAAKDVPDYRQLKKSIKKYIGKQYKITNAYVLQIAEYDDYTWLLVETGTDWDDIFDVIVLGTNDILEGDYVDVYFVPTSSGYYDTIGNEKHFAVYGVAKAVEKHK